MDEHLAIVRLAFGQGINRGLNVLTLSKGRGPMSGVGNTVFHMGQWRVDPALDEISLDDKTVKLAPRAMRVLLCLAERPGEVISVNQLLDVVWKDLVVTPYSVYQAVSALRRALGDDPKDP